MPEKTDEKSKIEFKVAESDVSVNDEIIMQMAYLALSEIEGIIPIANNRINKFIHSFLNDESRSIHRGISLKKETEEGKRDNLQLSIEFYVTYGYNIATLVTKAKNETIKAIKRMLDMDVNVVEVKIIGVIPICNRAREGNHKENGKVKSE
jgi:uncharacterized alkaline shock family protein YloU